MFDSIKNFVNTEVPKPVNSDDVATLAKTTFGSITNEVIPGLRAVSDSDEFFTSERIEVMSKLGSLIGDRSSDPRDTVKVLLEFFKEVAASESEFNKLLDKNISETIFPALATARDIAILKTYTDISSITLYMLDLLYYVTTDADTEFPKKRLEYIRESIPYLSSIINLYYKKFDKHIKELSKVANTVVDVEANSSMMDKLLAKHGKLVMLGNMSGFINNPIYHIRLWFADDDITKYESLKEKRKLIELKLLDLKMKSQGKHDSRLDKQIKYYEDKITGVEYDIKEMSEDLE